MFFIAMAHSVFNVVNTVVFLPFVGYLEKLSIILVPKKKGAVDLAPKYLEKHLLDTPPIALEQARKETVRMLNMACESVELSATNLDDVDRKAMKKVNQLEQAVDNLQSEITQYLVELSQKNDESGRVGRASGFNS